MELLDLPPEVFQNIIHEFVADVGINKAWRCRQVCRTFSLEIHSDIVVRQPLSVVLPDHCPTSVGKILEHNIVQYSFNRTKNPLDANTFLPNAIKNVVNSLMQVEEYYTEYCTSECTLMVCRLVETIHPGCTIDLLSYAAGCTVDLLNYSASECEYKTYPSEDRQAKDRLTIAAASGHHSLVRGYLQDLGVNARCRGLFGSPLENAVIFQQPRMVAVLLEHVQTIHTAGQDVTTWVMGAVPESIRRKYFDLTKQVVGWYYSVIGKPVKDIYNAWLNTAVDMGDIEVVEYLLSPSLRGRTVVNLGTFNRSCRRRQFETAIFLLGKGVVGPDTKHRGSSPLLTAVSTGRDNFIRAVLKAGAHVDGTAQGTHHRRPKNPLCQAVEQNKEHVVKLLLEEGANPEADRDGNKIFPLDIAFKKKAKNKAIYDMIRAALMKKTEVNIPTFEERKSQKKKRGKS
ncbi:hypothetical protein K504DRAFT_487502 [Pleomassaria siparia CBS 279.74]|uniref:Uncharacterized protein n=1 Tax=Pleomassaria siparia CBS 279.74 TaxID=1314801 RepID=A0A6G1KKP4_9PLEO|nr:hypothetical protein K504DRAFT_487502 [Pleomassaria siparia CBS 279.74]